MDEQLNKGEQDEATAEATATEQETKPEARADSKTFTQDELDRIVRERLERERKKYADYKDLKEAADKWEQLQEQQKSEEDKLRDKLTKAEQEAERLRTERREMLIRTAIVSEAQKLGFADPDDAYSLINLAEVTVTDNDKVEGVGELLKVLGEMKPYLLAKHTPRVSATNAPRGQREVEADEERRQRLFGGGEDIFTKGGGVFVNLKETQDY